LKIRNLARNERPRTKRSDISLFLGFLVRTDCLFERFTVIALHRYSHMTKNMLVSGQAISDEVTKALGNEYSRRILLSIIWKSLSAEEISQERNIPLSTCYRRIHALETSGIIRKDKTTISQDGKKLVRYISVLKNATINFESGKVAVEVSLNGNLELDPSILAPEIIR
jgi:hypothetical protein